MKDYKIIVKYYIKGINHSKIAKICSCSRPTVIKVIRKLEELNMKPEEFLKLKDREVFALFNPMKESTKEEYLIPDFKWEYKQMIKHRSSIRLCWRRYCKRAEKQGLNAYVWSRYLSLYQEYLLPPKLKDMNKIKEKLLEYNLFLSFYDNEQDKDFLKMKKEKEQWLESLGLTEEQILNCD